MSGYSKNALLLSVWSAALDSEAFSSRHIPVDDLVRVLPRVRERAFQRLIQALLREQLISPAHIRHEAGHACIDLPNGAGQIQFQHLQPHRMAAWSLGGSIHLCRDATDRQELLFPSDLLELLAPLLDPAPDDAALSRLSLELDDSFCNDTLCIAFHDQWNAQLARQAQQAGSRNMLDWLRKPQAAPNPSCLLEQWGTLGHPWHPNYKSKLPMTTADVIQYSPEFDAQVTVQTAALRRDVAHCESMHPDETFMTWWTEHFPESTAAWAAALRGRGLDPDAWLPVPVHPFQARALQSDFGKEISAGQLILTTIPAFTGRPGMSFRTLWSGEQPDDPMIKLPVSLRLTSVQRTVSPRSARMGPRISRLLGTILAREPHLSSVWDFVPERHGLHYAPVPPDDERARHLGIVCRDNPLSRLRPGELAIPVGSLFALDHENQPLLRQWILLAQGATDAAAARRFFLHYAAIVIQPLLELYLVYGIAFEAHQQNSLMTMNRDAKPARLLMRDFGDLRIHRASLHAQGLSLELYDPELTFFDDAEFVRDKLLHAVFMCHLGELALLCERQWPQPGTGDLWSGLRELVAQTFDALRPRVDAGRWETERTALLTSPWPAKAFIKMRLAETQTDLMGKMANPLAGPSGG